MIIARATRWHRFSLVTWAGMTIVAAGLGHAAAVVASVLCLLAATASLRWRTRHPLLRLEEGRRVTLPSGELELEGSRASWRRIERVGDALEIELADGTAVRWTPTAEAASLPEIVEALRSSP